MIYNKIDKSEIEQYLVNGVYYYSTDLKQLSLKNSKQINRYKYKYPFKKIYRYILKICISKFVRIKINSENKIFDGKIVLMPSSKYGYKIFSDTQVLTYFRSKDEFNKQLNIRNKTSRIFNTPKITLIKSNYIIEEQMNGEKINSKNVLNYILDSYINAIKNKVIKYGNMKLSISKYDSEFEEIITYIKPNNNSYISMPQHGDLWTGNIIVNNNKIYVLDYEIYDDRYFLFDFFFYIYTNKNINNDNENLKQYLNGEFDSKLELLFKEVGLKYEINLKVEYFNTFFICYINELYKSNDFERYKRTINEVYKTVQFINKHITEMNILKK